MRRNAGVYKFLSGVALAAMLFLLSSCNLLALHRDLRAGTTAGGVAGKVIHDESDASTIVVFALREEAGTWVVDNYVHLTTRQDFLMRLVVGEHYRIGAFADRNDNLRPDGDEPAVISMDPVTVAQGWNGVAKISLALAPTDRLDPASAAALQDLVNVELRPLPVWIGEVADIDDDRFSVNSGNMGLWRPFEFLANVGIGVFFLEPYDPQRIPVLFVSGAGGNPWEWRTMIDALDRSRYQPWLFVYPSGQRLATSAEVLKRSMAALQREFGVSRLYVTAHSMGGLVARDFIQRRDGAADSPSVPVFITLATPWRGHRAARMGVERSPAIVPSWIDMQIDSEYQQTIFARPLSGGTAYYLFYAQTDPAQSIERATDGTVSVLSQLHPDAVRDAREVIGFTETHVSVLGSPAVIAAYLHILGMSADAPGR